MKKGQYIRLFIGEAAASTAVIGAAKECQLHVSAQLEDSTTKDTTGDWQEQEVVALSYDISSMQLLLTDDDTLLSNGLETLQSLQEANTKVYWQLANVSGTNNRTKGTILASGSGYIQNLSVNAQNKQNVSVNFSLTGSGALTVGS